VSGESIRNVPGWGGHKDGRASTGRAGRRRLQSTRWRRGLLSGGGACYVRLPSIQNRGRGKEISRPFNPRREWIGPRLGGQQICCSRASPKLV
jgi:hypothetical protein